MSVAWSPDLADRIRERLAGRDLDEQALQDEAVSRDWTGRALAFHRSLPGG